MDATESVLLKKSELRKKPEPIETKSDPDCRSIVREARAFESGAIEIEARIAKAGIRETPGVSFSEYPRVEVRIRLVPIISSSDAVQWRREGEPLGAFPRWYLNN